MRRRTGFEARTETRAGRALRGGTRAAFAGLLLSLATACASPPPLPQLPPVSATATGLVTPGKFVWGDLLTQDVEASKAFYGGVFGWSFTTNGRYTTVLNAGTPIAGIVKARDAERGTEWIGNLSVADVDRATEVFRKRGGVDRDPIDAPDRGRISLVSTPGGAVMLLVRATDGDPADADPVIGSWLWWELWTHDVPGSLALLAQATGIEPETIDLDGEAYHVLRDAKARRAGINDAPPEVHPTWLPYFRVADLEASIEQAVALGARLVDRNERNAILVDPNRAEFAVGIWAKETDRIMQEAK